MSKQTGISSTSNLKIAGFKCTKEIQTASAWFVSFVHTALLTLPVPVKCKFPYLLNIRCIKTVKSKQMIVLI